MGYEEMIQKYRATVKELMASGAESREAEILAAQLVVARGANGNEDAELYRRLKQEGVPYAYFYGSFIIEKLAVNARPKMGVQMTVRIPVGHRPAKFEFETYQAVRILSLLKGKFSEFEKDVSQGFLYSDLDRSDQDLITKKKLNIDYANIPSSRELHRVIRDKFNEELENNAVIERLNPEGPHALVRLGFSPSRVIFQSEKVFSQFETLTDQAFTGFSDRYGVRMPYSG